MKLNYKNIKSWTVLVYILFLVTLSLIFAVIVLNNYSILSNYTIYSDFESKLYANIKDNAEISINLDKKLNSNWSWFIDDISCPDSIFLSWTVDSWTVSSSLYYTETSIFCSWSYLNLPLKIYFNTGYTDFIQADYNWYLAAISSWTWYFLDPDNTYIDFSASSYTNWDFIDDDFNSDDYKYSSIWNHYYPNWYSDDDDLARKILFWYVTIEAWYKKVFWNNTKTSKIIAENTNNTWSLNVNIWDVTSWRLYFDIDWPYDLKIYEFDKARYDEFNELIIKDSILHESTNWKVWYLQKNWNVVPTLTWNEYDFDFKNKDYAIFLNSTGNWTILYSLKAEDNNTWSWIYIAPIDDSMQDIIRFLWNEILIDAEGRFLSKQSELIFRKDAIMDWSLVSYCIVSWSVIYGSTNSTSDVWLTCNDDITVCTWVWTWYTLQACNLWSTVASSDWTLSSWAYFQWWNNYASYSGWLTTSTLVDASSYWPWNYFTSTRFINWSTSYSYDWTTVQNDNLWWDVTDTSEARQWPCSAWYHVPTRTEWENIAIAGWWDASNDWLGMKNALKLTYSGNRRRYDGVLDNGGARAYYWTSSDWLGAGYANNVMIVDTWIYNWYTAYHSQANSIRCFKN